MHAESLEVLERLARQLAGVEAERRVARDFAHGLQKLLQGQGSPQISKSHVTDGKENRSPTRCAPKAVRWKTPGEAAFGGQPLQERMHARTNHSLPANSCCHRQELEYSGSRRETSNSSISELSGQHEATASDEDVDEELASVARCSGRIRATQARLRESLRQLDEQFQLAKERLSAAKERSVQPRQAGALQERLEELQQQDAKLTAQLKALHEEQSEPIFHSPGTLVSCS